ncbi:hypothetical protein LBMAG42_22300 [Deltaproteobacteria bacterium]|nr:hypothetical protein LBMAG42_22300 [Deltaproteobacteria bacterium]
MRLLLFVLAVGGCRTHPPGGTSEAVDDRSLPEGVVAFRDAVRSAGTLRVWLVDPDASWDCLGGFSNGLHESMWSVRSDGVVVMDRGGGGRRRWAPADPPVAVPAYRDSLGRVRQAEPRGSIATRETTDVMKALIAQVRSEGTRWVNHEPPALERSAYFIHLRPSGLPPGGWRLTVRFTADGRPSLLVAENDDRESPSLSWLERRDGDGVPGRVSVAFARFEIDPPLPADWFESDETPAGLNYPDFSDGAPTSALDAHYYTPGASVPASLGDFAFDPGRFTEVP